MEFGSKKNIFLINMNIVTKDKLENVLIILKNTPLIEME